MKDFDPYLAPEGYKAVPSDGGRCDGCAFRTPGSGSCLPRPCIPFDRPDKMDAIFVKRETPPAYLAEDVTVGELVRWINSEVVKASREEDSYSAHALAEMAERVESALSAYRAANPTP